MDEVSKVFEAVRELTICLILYRCGFRKRTGGSAWGGQCKASCGRYHGSTRKTQGGKLEHISSVR